MEMSKAGHKALNTKTKIQEVNQLISLYDNYFAIADALVQTSGARASVKSKSLISSIESVKTDKLADDFHGI